MMGPLMSYCKALDCTFPVQEDVPIRERIEGAIWLDIKEIAIRIRSFPDCFSDASFRYTEANFRSGLLDLGTLQGALPAMRKRMESLMKSTVLFWKPIASPEEVLRSPPLFFRLMRSYRFRMLAAEGSAINLEWLRSDLFRFTNLTQSLNEQSLEIERLFSLPPWPFSEGLLEEKGPLLMRPEPQPAKEQPLHLLNLRISLCMNHCLSLKTKPDEERASLIQLALACTEAIEHRQCLYLSLQKTVRWQIPYYEHFVGGPLPLWDFAFINVLPDVDDEESWLRNFWDLQRKMAPYFTIIQKTKEFVQPYLDGIQRKPPKTNLVDSLFFTIKEQFPNVPISWKETETLALVSYFSFRTQCINTKKLREASDLWERRGEKEIAAAVDKKATTIDRLYTKRLLREVPADFPTSALMEHTIRDLAHTALWKET